MFSVFLPVLVFNQNRWESTFGIPDDDNYLFNKSVDYDESILINWMIESNGNRYVSKMDINGNEIWRQAIINSQTLTQLNVLLSNTQSTIVGGSTYDFPFIMSLNKCYNIKWCSNFINQQLFDHGHFVDAVFLDNGDILAMAYIEPPHENWNDTDRIYLFYYDSTGVLLWYRLYASGEDYPLIDTPDPIYLTKFEDYYIISGLCWYPDPDNSNLMVLRPLFIRIDNLFNEQWVLPYGVQDDFVGIGSAVIEDKRTGENIGVGRYAGLPGIFSVTPLMHFDSLGNETGTFLILNDSIGPNIQSNSTIDIINVGDDKYLLSSSFGSAPSGNPIGELLLDSSYRVIASLPHPNTDINDTRIDTLPNNKFLFGVNIYENPPTNYNRDILLYKLNGDLSQLEPDTTPHVYDSLCDYSIVSDTILLSGCDIITDITEIPTPQQYFSSLKTINIKVSPNPASSSLNFELENDEHYENIIFKCYNMDGKPVLETILPNGETTIKTDVTSWKNGIYVAVASGSKGEIGSKKFIVKR